MIKLLFSIGNALLTLGSVASIGKRLHQFSKAFRKHNHSQYTRRRR